MRSVFGIISLKTEVMGEREAKRNPYLGMVSILAFFFCLGTSFALEISNRYRSPRNPERKIRPSTDFIVLHTTEAPARSSLNKVSERGECHYCVTEDGTIYRIVDRDREAFHAGRSMWNNREDLDKFSIGIECVGEHNKPMSIVQLRAIRDLVKELKTMYRLGDERVVTHSMVAYGAPNKWHKKKHRGRKRCGMLFAMPSVRKVLDLKKRMSSDPDVRAKRLVVGDEYLEKVLYGKIDTMRKHYATAALPPSKQSPQPKSERGGFFKFFRKADQPAPATPKQSPAPRTTTARPSALQTPPRNIAELNARGYKKRGEVSRGKTASQIVGSKWNRADTYYTIRDKVIPGNIINPSRIEVGMAIWTK